MYHQNSLLTMINKKDSYNLNKANMRQEVNQKQDLELSAMSYDDLLFQQSEYQEDLNVESEDSKNIEEKIQLAKNQLNKLNDQQKLNLFKGMAKRIKQLKQNIRDIKMSSKRISKKHNIYVKHQQMVIASEQKQLAGLKIISPSQAIINSQHNSSSYQEIKNIEKITQFEKAKTQQQGFSSKNENNGGNQWIMNFGIVQHSP
ncbi:UNKNOWN [Stylonychia lemnae]|uniref:Uncharacterized protein n=1 Tax=Stylonychia lemnae TaxID=5949 RepID=A0A078A2W9_STYLE|nr:UNKNOWN [Stylonychia lemnae]|eukprot:CDW76628.1 UNKNOWN [Stylonychia lemnae]